MEATALLKAEHSSVKRMLAVLERVCGRIERGDRPATYDLEGIVEFLQVFADRHHHGKEEGVLFPALVAAGLPRSVGPIPVLLAEHDEARACVRGLAEGFRSFSAGGDGTRIVDDARAFISLLILHIRKEEIVIFPIADERFNALRQGVLIEGFKRLAAGRLEEGAVHRFLRMLERLERAYPTAPALPLERTSGPA
ncbi:MAG: hemerythrin domain-containing protein [Elusimicrobiota bacterium]|jgi:hemerythrin-like domain-containing protein